jgi:hypothetical protein
MNVIKYHKNKNIVLINLRLFYKNLNAKEIFFHIFIFDVNINEKIYRMNDLRLWGLCGFNAEPDSP